MNTVHLSTWQSLTNIPHYWQKSHLTIPVLLLSLLLLLSSFLLSIELIKNTNNYPPNPKNYHCSSQQIQVAWLSKVRQLSSCCTIRTKPWKMLLRVPCWLGWSRRSDKIAGCAINPLKLVPFQTVKHREKHMNSNPMIVDIHESQTWFEVKFEWSISWIHPIPVGPCLMASCHGRWWLTKPTLSAKLII